MKKPPHNKDQENTTRQTNSKKNYDVVEEKEETMGAWKNIFGTLMYDEQDKVVDINIFTILGTM